VFAQLLLKHSLSVKYAWINVSSIRQHTHKQRCPSGVHNLGKVETVPSVISIFQIIFQNHGNWHVISTQQSETSIHDSIGAHWCENMTRITLTCSCVEASSVLIFSRGGLVYFRKTTPNTHPPFAHIARVWEQNGR